MKNFTSPQTLGAIALGISLLGTSALADFVILDDLIVDGSACIGFDCIDGEAFGFDTLRLKENNLRIRAVDTSSTASYPTNDWQITFNDSANGGQAKFSIDDIDGGRTPLTIEAGAPSHSLYVDDGGRLGLGTSIPTVEIHIKDGDTPTLRLEQDGSSSFTPQTWDVAGNETNFFVRDVTNGSLLPLRIRPDAPTSSIDIAASGNVGIGTDAPSDTLHVNNSSGNATILIESPGQQWKLRSHSATTQLQIRNGSDTIVMRLGAAGGQNLLNVGMNADGTADAPGVINVAGSIVATGTITPDFVFGPEYELESIQNHAAFMWSQAYLPAVGPGTTNAEGKGVVNLVERSQGVLEKLEKAHIYIEQLNNRLEALEKLLADNG